MRWMTAAMVTLATIGAACTPARAESTAREVGYGAGSAAGTVVYVPFKTAFCVVGAVTSGLALPFGGTRTAGHIATSACGGTWVITPEVLKGNQPVHFVGEHR